MPYRSRAAPAALLPGRRRGLHFGRGAARLYVSQPSLSNQIHKLEQTLGADLFVRDSPNMTVIPSELFSAEVPGRVLAGKVEVGLALHPEPMRGVRSELLRIEPLALLVGKRHRLADASSIPLANLENETLLAFPRELAPAYYDAIITACEQAGFQPRVRAFPAPPPSSACPPTSGTRGQPRPGLMRSPDKPTSAATEAPSPAPR